MGKNINQDDKRYESSPFCNMPNTLQVPVDVDTAGGTILSMRAYFTETLQLTVAGLRNIEVKHLLLDPVGTVGGSLLLGRDILFKYFSTSISREPGEKNATVTVTEIESDDSAPAPLPTKMFSQCVGADGYFTKLLSSKPSKGAGWKLEHILFGDDT
jgi:hypothetical protein